MQTTSIDHPSQISDLWEQALHSTASQVHEPKKQNLTAAECAAQSLEDQLLRFYRVTVFVAKAEESMEKTAQLWEVMSAVCQAFTQKLETLQCETPYCATIRDRMLDLANRCQRIRDLHKSPN